MFMNPTPTAVSFGCQVATYGDVRTAVERAIRAEAAGFDLVTLPDHLFHPTGSEEFLTEPPWEVMTTLGALAERTETVDLMPGVADSVRRHPTEMAHAIATLDRLTDGRAGFGIGAGEAFNFAPINDIDWRKPFTRFRECVSVITGLWQSTPADRFTFDGEYFSLTDAYLGFKPHQNPYPPLWIGGYGPKMRTLTGRIADGWFPWVYSPDVYADDLERVLDAAEKAGRNPDSLDRAVMIPSTVLADGDEARELALPRNRINLALRPPLLADMGYEAIAEDTPIMWEMAFDEDQSGRLTDAAARIPDAAVEEIGVVGDPETAIDQVQRFIDAGVSHLVIIPVGDVEATLANYESEVIPYFQGE